MQILIIGIINSRFTIPKIHEKLSIGEIYTI